MKISKIIYGFVFMAFATVFVVSCNEDDEATFEPLAETPKNIAELVEGNENLATLVTALTQSDVDSILRSTTTYTFFAPQNDAFTGIDIAAMNADERDNLLLNHVVSTTTPDFVKAMTTGYLTTMGVGPDETNLSLFVNADSELVLNGAVGPVSGMTDIGATNGVIHIVNGVMEAPTVVNHIMANPDFSSFATAIEMAGLEDTLSGAGPFTILVPNNTAFEAFMSTLNGAFGYTSLDDIPSDSDLLQQVLTYHMLTGTNTVSGDLTGELTTMQGEVVTIGDDGIADSSYDNGNTDVVDIQGINGVLHSVDKVLLPEAIFQSVLSETLDIVARSSDRGYSTFVQAIEMVGLTDAVSSDELTAFAPTNDAFDYFFGKAENFESLADFDTDEELVILKKLVEYHLYSGVLMSSALVDGDITSVLGDVFTVDVSGAAPKLVPTYDDAPKADISESNIGASNGVIQGISRVLVSTDFGTEVGYPLPEPVLGGAPIFALSVYGDALSDGFSAWDGWGGTYDFASSDVVSTGESAIKLTYDGQWGSAQIGAGNIDVSSYSTFHMSIYGETATTVLVALCDCDTGVEVALTPGQWTSVEIPVSSFGDLDMSAIRIKEVTNDGVGSQTIYVDDIGFDLLGYEQVQAQVPTFALPIFTDQLETGFSAWDGWGGAYNFAFSDKVKNGSAAIELVYDGQWGSAQIGAGNIDVSGYSNLNFSVYGETATTILVALCDCDTGVEVAVEAGKWTDVEIPVSSFGDLTMGAIRIKEATNDGVGGQTIYIDDFGFDITGYEVVLPTFDLPVYGDALADGFSAWDGWGGAYDFASTDEISTGEASIKLTYDGQWGSAQIGAGNVDVSGYSTFHFSVYGEVATTVLVALCDCDTGVEVAITPGQWENIEIPIGDFGDLDMSAIRFKEATNDGVGGQTIYIDDVGFNN